MGPRGEGIEDDEDDEEDGDRTAPDRGYGPVSESRDDIGRVCASSISRFPSLTAISVLNLSQPPQTPGNKGSAHLNAGAMCC